MTDTRFRCIQSAAVAALLTFSIAPTTHAQQPTGWISNGHVSAYTLKPGEFELSGSALQVNDTIDFLNLRDDLLSGNSRLIDNSGDLSGTRGELRLGVWKGLELFYSRQQQDMTLKINPSSRANIIDLDDQLETTSTRWGARFVVFESGSNRQDRASSSLALQISRSENNSKAFGGFLQELRFNANVVVTLDPPQYFSMDRLADDGWQSRLIYSTALGSNTTLSAWVGYGESDASSGTSTEIDNSTIQDAFLQTFDLSEKQYLAGFNLNFQQIPRLPVQLGYEYLNISNRDQNIVSSNSSLLPSFLRGGNLADSATSNHTAYGTVSWWATPHLYASLSGKVFRNQFVGIMPHFNNPLSASFSDTLYGFVELKLGFKFIR
ncbi:hypothetical protein [Pseudohongiella spirulinae]|uniref:Uncharacterized protein n=1 Tax=Pseudohongiella spirulinae TaxID=1249552 RepID=A0A0S2KEQ3_9GAMM|nr:hypothetical protein [Pseudohongiella spirulinae]ALO46434.1 hypothetical protein PS2015_1784 [Pseudohongiella spirulinae]